MTKKSNKKKSYKKLSLKLSRKQLSSLQNYCILNDTTPNKLIKNLLKPYLEDYTDEKLGKEEMDRRQLSLFKEPKPEDYEQLQIFIQN